jgi:hypothetical protein
MRSLISFSAALLICTALFAQNRSGFVNTPGITRNFGSVVFPGGTSALSGVQRSTGSVVFPGGGGPQIGVPAAPLQGLGYTTFTPKNGVPGIGYGGGRFGQGNGNRYPRQYNNSGVYAYPVFVGGGYYGSDYYDNGYATDGTPAAMVQPQPQVQQQPNVVVIYPPSANQAMYPLGPGGAPGPSSSTLYPSQPSAEQSAQDDQATRYLIALKNHTIYSAVAYWVDGDTLHYFTSGNTHNQVSLSLVDRALTDKLNQGSGLEVKLPPVK